MRKTSTAQTETVGKIEQGYCTINSWRNTTKSAFSVETESVKETWSCLLYQPKKRLSHRRKMTLKSTNQTLEKKTIHSKVMMYCLLGASWHFLFFSTLVLAFHLWKIILAQLYRDIYAESQVNTAIYTWPHYTAGSSIAHSGCSSH